MLNTKETILKKIKALFIVHCPARTHGTVDKAFLQGASELNHLEAGGSIPTTGKTNITKNAYYNLTLVPSHD